MAIELAMLQIGNRQQWRVWLQKHHASSPGVWLMFQSKDKRPGSLSYEEALREALCFGWIDSLIKRIDETQHARKFTPRRESSKWSEANRKRWVELRDAGVLAPAGLTAAPTNNSYAVLLPPPELPTYISKALRLNAAAWSFFQELAPSHRRQFVVWIHSAKRPETRQKRIRESISLLTAKKKLGLK